MIPLLIVALLGFGLSVLYRRTPGLGRETAHRLIDLLKWIGRTHLVNPAKEFFK